MSTSQKVRELKSHGKTHKASIWRTPSCPNQIAASPENRATSTQVQKEKFSQQTQTGVTVNCYVEMTHIKVRRSRATTSSQLQTGCHPQATTTGVQSVVILPTRKDSHAQQKSISARYVINLGTLQANVFKRNNILNRNTDNLNHIKYK